MNKQITINQHYIPQFILRNFASSQIPYKLEGFYRYDKKNDTEKFLSKEQVKTQCFSKNLYEFILDRKIISKENPDRNVIENYLSNLENKWNVTTQKVIKKEEVSNEEKQLLYLLTAIQILRTPEAINFNKEYLKNVQPSLKEDEAENYAKIASLLLKSGEPEKDFLLRSFYTYLTTFNLSILVSKNNEFIIGNQRPVLCMLPFEKANKDDALWIFPISKNVCLKFAKKEEDAFYKIISKNELNFINMQIYENEGNVIYSAKPIRERFLKQNEYFK